MCYDYFLYNKYFLLLFYIAGYGNEKLKKMKSNFKIQLFI